MKSLFASGLASLVVLALAGPSARADIMYTINPDLSVSRSGNDSAEDMAVRIVNNSNFVIQQLHMYDSQGYNLFGFDSDESSTPGVTYNPVVNNDNAFVNFGMPTVFGANGLAPGATATLGLENDRGGASGLLVDVFATRAVPAVDPVPEPATAALLGLGLAGLAASRLRRRNRPAV